MNGGIQLYNNKSAWRNTLLLLRNESFATHKPINIYLVTETMKMVFPGEYVVEEYFNKHTMVVDLRLKFTTPEDETWFLLQYE